MYKLIERHDDHLVVEIPTRIAHGNVVSRQYLIDPDIESQRRANAIKQIHDLAEVDANPNNRGGGSLFAEGIRASTGSVPVGRLLFDFKKGHKRTPGAAHNDLRRSAWQ